MIWIVLAGILLLVDPGVGGSWASKAYRNRQLTGDLSFDPANRPAGGGESSARGCVY